jgi:hypothetical protein
MILARFALSAVRVPSALVFDALVVFHDPAGAADTDAASVRALLVYGALRIRVALRFRFGLLGRRLGGIVVPSLVAARGDDAGSEREGDGVIVAHRIAVRRSRGGGDRIHIVSGSV